MKTNTIHLSIFFITLLFLTGIASINQNNIVLPLVEKKKLLLQSMDSLDLLKQNQKRHGQSFAEIESKQQNILDSLNSIRNKIQTQLSSSPSKAKSSSPFKYLNIIDLTLLVTGVIALFCGIMLLYGIAKKMLIPQNKKSSIKRKDTPSLKGNTAMPLTDNLSDNTKKIVIDSKDDPNNEFNFNIQTELEKLQVQITNETVATPAISSSNITDLEESVIKASLNGMNVQEISRQLHLSSDHVSLIVRLAETRKTRNNSPS